MYDVVCVCIFVCVCVCACMHDVIGGVHVFMSMSVCVCAVFCTCVCVCVWDCCKQEKWTMLGNVLQHSWSYRQICNTRKCSNAQGGNQYQYIPTQT